jgi:hypothetical protein
VIGGSKRVIIRKIGNNSNCHELPYSSYEPVILEKDEKD